jgi:hypothetical protein
MSQDKPIPFQVPDFQNRFIGGIWVKKQVF